MQRLAGDALEVAVHADGRLHDAVDLFLAFGPLFGNGFPLSIEVFAHGRESFNNRLNSLAEALTGEILIDHFHLRLLAFGSLTCRSDFDQCVAKCDGYGQQNSRMGDPDAVDEVKRLDIFGESLTDDDGDLGLGGPLVLAELGKPGIAPVFGALGLPENRAARLAERAHDAVQHVAAEFAFGDGLDHVTWESRAEQRFDFQFLNFSLKLLRALFGSSFQILDLTLHGHDGLLFFQYFKFEFLFGIFFGLVTCGVELRLDALGNR